MWAGSVHVDGGGTALARRPVARTRRILARARGRDGGEHVRRGVGGPERVRAPREASARRCARGGGPPRRCTRRATGVRRLVGPFRVRHRGSRSGRRHVRDPRGVRRARLRRLLHLLRQSGGVGTRRLLEGTSRQIAERKFRGDREGLPRGLASRRRRTPAPRRRGSASRRTASPYAPASASRSA